jgi:O-antigen/teichoic acid export membrane protein
MAGNVLSQALAFFVLPVFTRYLTPDDYGILSYTGSITSFLLILSTLSLNSFILRHYFEIQTEQKRKELFGTIFIFIVSINIILLYIEFLIFPHALKWLNIKIPFHPYFKIALVINFLEVTAIVPLVYYRVTRKAWQYFWLTSSRAVLIVLVGLVLVIGYDMGVMGRYYGSFFANTLFLVIYLTVIFKVARPSFDLSTIKKGLRFSLPLLPAAFASIAIISSDRIILERYVSLSQIGIYSVGVTLGTVLLIVVRSFYLAVEPEIYDSFNSNGFEEKVVRLKNYFLYAVLFIGSIIIIFSREIVATMAADRFYESYKIIPFFVTGTIFRGAEILVGTTLFALNKTIYQPIIVGAALMVNIIGNLALVPFMGILGAAVSSTMSFAVLYVVSVYITNKFSEIRWNCLRDISLILLCCGISAVIMHIQLSTLLLTILIKALIVLSFAFMAFNILVKDKISLHGLKQSLLVVWKQ